MKSTNPKRAPGRKTDHQPPCWLTNFTMWGNRFIGSPTYWLSATYWFTIFLAFSNLLVHQLIGSPTYSWDETLFTNYTLRSYQPPLIGSVFGSCRTSSPESHIDWTSFRKGLRLQLALFWWRCPRLFTLSSRHKHRYLNIDTSPWLRTVTWP